MPTQFSRQPLTGNWIKVSQSSGNVQYPQAIEFRVNGIYIGSAGEPGGFTVWDAGKYEAVGMDSIQISTANDSVVEYRWHRSGDLLKFIDGDRCEITYRRQA